MNLDVESFGFDRMLLVWAAFLRFRRRRAGRKVVRLRFETAKTTHANPSSFLDLEIEPDGTVLFPSGMQQSTSTPCGCLPICGAALGSLQSRLPSYLKRALGLGELKTFCDEVVLAEVTQAILLCPVHVVGPMGFSSISAVAQETTMVMCLKVQKNAFCY